MKSMTMDVIATIYGRRAVRAYRPDPVSSTAIEKLIGAAVQAPSAMDLEPWAFVVVEGAARLKRFSDRAKAHLLPQPEIAAIAAPLREMLADPAFNIFHDAPTLVVVCAANATTQAAEDCCLAAENLMLAAHAEGLGTCPIGFARAWLNLPETKAELGIDPRFVPVFPLVIGYPAERAKGPIRKEPTIIRA
jgi:nitroreductase